MSRVLDLAHYVYSADITDPEATYTEVAEAGFQSVVLGPERGPYDLRVREQALAFGRLLADLGLRAPACHGLDLGPGGLNDPDDAARAALVAAHAAFMAIAAELEARTYVLHLGPTRPDEPLQLSLDRIRAAVDVLAVQAEQVGLLLALENGLPDYIVTNEALAAFVADLAHPAVGICYDSGHAHVTGDAAEVLELFAPHVVTVHLHDNDGASDQHLIPGQGTTDWPRVVAALARCPRLVHAESEAVNSAQWGHTPEVWPQDRVYARYMDVLNQPDTGVTYR